jgi:hypothetical protein
MVLVKELGDPAAHGVDVTVDQAEICFEKSARIVGFVANQKRRLKL